MVQVSFPGVYIQEVPSGVRTITGVSTGIAAFVGMANDGPMFKPTTVLGFADYTRIFSADTSQGEMTDQVRQFFLNGGQQAVIVRIAHDADAAVVSLNGDDGALNVLVLEARAQGTEGNFLRARIDYNTATPERTFNLTVYEEILDANNVGTAGASETFSNLSLEPNHPRYVERLVEEESQLVGGVTVALGAATRGGFSVPAVLGEASTVVVGGEATQEDNARVLAAAALAQRIHDAAAGIVADPAQGVAAGIGRFRVRVGTTAFIVEIDAAGGNEPADIKTQIDAALNSGNPGGATAEFVTVLVQEFVAAPETPARALCFLKIEADDVANEVFIEPQPNSSDIALVLGLGTAQGGIEVGRFATRRPPANGIVSRLSSSNDAVDTFDSLMKLASLPKLDLAFELTAPPGEGFAIPDLFADVATADVFLGGTHTPASQFSLITLRQSLVSIANKINAASTKWRSAVYGHRLALLPSFGNASSGGGAGYAIAAADLNPSIGTTPAPLFKEAVSSASNLANGSNGTTPDDTDYDRAYLAIDANVDIFNILVLPRSAETDNRATLNLWAAASTFCRQRRAFLLIDARGEVESIDSIILEVKKRRIGIVKDHSALYWPRLRVNPDGISRFVDPSGSIAGVMARTDATRGVWKAPAGLEADARGVLGVKVPMSDPENGRVNPQAVNAIRVFPNGVISWGARTMDGFDNSGNDDFKYVPVRRLTLFIEESLYRGLKFAVFEPNDEPLWAQLRLAVGSFLNTLFRQGAFAGRTTRDAYFVKVDAETTTQNDINLGIVNVVVGFAPLKPAEFVVITIQQKAGQIQV